MKALKKVAIIAFFLLSFHSSFAYANNLSITNVSLGQRNASSNSVEIKFDVSWQNSWKTKINHDAVWLTARLYSPTASPSSKKLCQLIANGLNPAGSSSGSNSGLEVYVPSDRMGAFVRPSSYGIDSTTSSTDAKLTVDYSSCGFADNETVYASVVGLEMVYIPEGSFYVGDNNTSSGSLNQGSSDSDPWNIVSESAVSVSNPSSNGFRYVSGSHSGEDSTGSSFSISADFPKGYKATYAMKYEITEGNWVEFLNALPTSAARAARDLTDNLHKNSDSVKNRNTISCSGTPLTCSTSKPSRALGYLSWMDLAAYLDWVALRPMTELEFEKITRGPILPAEGEFAWGSNTIIAATSISSGDEGGAETITNFLANAHFNSSTLSGGDAVNGADYQQGPLRSGIFANSSSTRESAGSGYYGVLDLSGNVKERVVALGNSVGRDFAGVHGDGQLSSSSGYEGNANVANWPGTDAISSRGVTGAEGSGFRGGSFKDSSSYLKISDRSQAAEISTFAAEDFGGRGVRTYDGE